MIMSLPPNIDKHFVVLIDTNGKSLTRFLDILKRERQLLNNKDYTKYQQILTEKQKEIQILAKLDKELAAFLQQVGLQFLKQAILHQVLEPLLIS